MGGDINPRVGTIRSSQEFVSACFRSSYDMYLCLFLPDLDRQRWLAEWADKSREDPQVPPEDDLVIVHCRVQADGRCDVGDCLEKLYSMGFQSLMVEVCVLMYHEFAHVRVLSLPKHGKSFPRENLVWLCTGWCTRRWGTKIVPGL